MNYVEILITLDVSIDDVRILLLRAQSVLVLRLSYPTTPFRPYNSSTSVARDD